jgi:hypothetical protein
MRRRMHAYHLRRRIHGCHERVPDGYMFVCGHILACLCVGTYLHGIRMYMCYVYVRCLCVGTYYTYTYPGQILYINIP